MKMWTKAILGISLSFMCLFTCVGYAALSGTIKINGNVEAEPPQMLFITNVSGGNYIDPDTLAYSGTVVKSDVTLRDGVAVYNITVLNNTLDDYYYLAMVRSTDDGQSIVYSNNNITMSIEGISRGDVVRAGAQKTFTVKASFKAGASTADPTLFSVIEYRFSTTKPESSDEAAISGVLSKFPEILNSKSYDTLKKAMSDRNGRQNASYIGNVVGADSADSTAIKSLFGDSLMMNIDGEDKPVTVMIKADNIDNNTNTGDNYKGLWGANHSGGEMTIYVTADTLSNTSTRADVYAIVYTMDQTTGEWYQLGDVYAGKADVKGYDNLFSGGTGSFDTSDWESLSRTYKVTDTYSYTIGTSTIGNIVRATDSNANAELRKLLQQARDIVEDDSYFAEQVESLSNALSKYSKYYTVSNGTVNISGSPSRAAIVPVIRDLDNLLKNFR